MAFFAGNEAGGASLYGSYFGKAAAAQPQQGTDAGAAEPPQPKQATAGDGGEEAEDPLHYVFASRTMQAAHACECRAFPAQGLPSNVAYQLAADARNLDANPRLNLASFVTTWIEREAMDLMTESLNVNFVDAEEYPSCVEMEAACCRMLLDLFHAPDIRDGRGTDGSAIGTATVGSSEAIMLAGIAFKMRWKAARVAAGLSPDVKPNLVIGAHAQVCWHKLCVYLDIACREEPVEEGRYHATPEGLASLVDEETIAVVAILGSTYNGGFDPVAEIDAAVRAASESRAIGPVPMHVDAASGGFVAPFLYPDLPWDFRLPSVCSINVSGHKYGFVVPGIGWQLWRSKDDVPEAMIFQTNYLGSDLPSLTVNFSRGASQVVASYYTLNRLGRAGFTRIIQNLHTVAMRLADGIVALGCFELVSDPAKGLPLVAWRIKPGDTTLSCTEFDIAAKLREAGWVLPAYTWPKNRADSRLMRAVVREDFSAAMCDRLLADLRRCVAYWTVHRVTEVAPPDATGAASEGEHGALLAALALAKARLKARRHGGVC